MQNLTWSTCINLSPLSPSNLSGHTIAYIINNLNLFSSLKFWAIEQTCHTKHNTVLIKSSITLYKPALTWAYWSPPLLLHLQKPDPAPTAQGHGARTPWCTCWFFLQSEQEQKSSNKSSRTFIALKLEIRPIKGIFYLIYYTIELRTLFEWPI